MLRKFGWHLRDQWIGAVALFLVLGGGTAYAVTRIDANSVQSKHIVDGQVKAKDLERPEDINEVSLPEMRPPQDCGLPEPADDGYYTFNPDFYGPVGYYRDSDGRVHLSGTIMRCGSTDNVAFTLPPGYRPAFEAQFDRDRPVFVGRGGQVSEFHGGSATAFSVSGISFRCAPSGLNGCP